MLTQILDSFELNSKEIKIFTKLLELGTQPASHIAHLCDMPRNTTRSILDKLVKAGILIKTQRANVQYYATEKKERLLIAIKRRKAKIIEQFDNQIQLLEQYGDELNLRHHSKSRPKITFYDGLSGLEKVYEDTLTAKNGIRSWANYDAIVDPIPNYFPSYFKRRAAKKIHMRSIHPDTEKSRAAKKRDKEELRESILLPKGQYNWTPEIQIYNNKINISSWKEKLGIIIESEEISEAMGQIFEICFNSIKPSKHN